MPDVSYNSFIGMMHYIYCNSVPDDFDGTSLTELWRGRFLVYLNIKAKDKNF